MSDAERIREELVYVLSIKNGLSETQDEIMWAQFAGMARGLLKAHDSLDSAQETHDRFDPVQKLISDLETMKEKYDRGETIIEGPEGDVKDALNEGFLVGLARGVQVKQGTLDEATTESFKSPPE